MRVAAYADSAEPTRGSVIELGILLVAILLGTGAVPTVVAYVGGVLPQLITPIWLSLYLAAFLGLTIRHGINWLSWLVRYRILLVLLLLGTMATITWSINPQMSAERFVHLLGSSLVAIYIGFMIPLLLTLRVFAVALAFLMFASLAVAIGLPDIGIEAYEGSQVWKGVFQSKNDLGFWAGVGVLLYITLSESSSSVPAKLLCFMMAGVCLGALALSQSATSLVAMLVAGSLALYLYIASRFELGFLRMAVIAVLFIALTGMIVANIETNELVGRSGDLTGRGEVWGQVINLINDNPLKGVGYGALWFPTDATLWVQETLFDFTWVVHHAHNGLLHIASEIGVPFSLLALLMVTQQLIEIFYCQYERRQTGVLFVLAFAVAFLISNYSEARFMTTRELFWIFFLALPIGMLRQMNTDRKEAAPVDADDGQFNDATYAGHYADYAHVNREKSWLGPIPGDPQPVSNRLSAAYAPSALLGYEGEADQNDTDDFETATSNLTLTETDIDLGGLIEENSVEEESIEVLPRRSAEEVEAEYARLMKHSGGEWEEFVPAPKKATVTAPLREPQTFDHNDTFDVDRYDIDFDLTGEWLDIDLDDSK